MEYNEVLFKDCKVELLLINNNNLLLGYVIIVVKPHFNVSKVTIN